jgi:hypothetical protein
VNPGPSQMIPSAAVSVISLRRRAAPSTSPKSIPAPPSCP